MYNIQYVYKSYRYIHTNTNPYLLHLFQAILMKKRCHRLGSFHLLKHFSVPLEINVKTPQKEIFLLYLTATTDRCEFLISSHKWIKPLQRLMIFSCYDINSFAG